MNPSAESAATSSSPLPEEATTSNTNNKKKREKNKPIIAESTVLRISQFLNQFRASNDTVYTFDSNSTFQERTLAQLLWKKMGMVSKRSGRRKKRKLSIFKREKKLNTVNGRDELAHFTVSEGAKIILHELFTKYSAIDWNPGEGLSSSSSAPADEARERKRQKQNLSVDEATLTGISQILQKFCTSNENVYTFDSSKFSTREQAVAQELCKKMGLTSKSSGRKKKRMLSIFKTKEKEETVKGKEDLATFSFSKEAKVELHDLFSLYPPVDCNLGEGRSGKDVGKSDKIQEKGGDFFCKPLMNDAQIREKLESLTSRIENVPEFRQITEAKARLPIASFRHAVTSTIESNQVVLISGETGCGKTTQVPQFLLDYMWGKGEVCKIVCTQPRRISAISVAERIACERGEIIGDNVGYMIRLESKGGRNSSIVFCTTGVLLRVLVSRGCRTLNAETLETSAKDVLSNITHIIVDEVHERDQYSDFMLAILRDMLPSYPSLRLVLMSATLDAERFSHYFGGCPVIQIPGFTCPVTTFYLEDVLMLLEAQGNIHLDCTSENTSHVSELTEEHKSALDEALDLAWLSDELDTLQDMLASEDTPKVVNYQHSWSGVTALMVFASKGRVADVCMLLSLGANFKLKTSDGITALEWAERENHTEVAEVIKKQVSITSDEEQDMLNKYLLTAKPESVDIALIEQLLRMICTDSKEGSVLLFLPGWDEIKRTKERLLMSPLFKDSSTFLIISLHSMVPSEEQKKVFQQVPRGCRKIILSTNIAETSITIDDVVYVIDSGRMKEKNYDPYSNVSTLQSSWVSKASAKQREGRAGRCQPGVCYHLFSKLLAASLCNFQVPEIQRIRIEELCLQVKLLDPQCEIEEFHCKILDPPDFETIHNAIKVLQDIGALSSGNELTDLGGKLGFLPVHPKVSRMIFFAILLKCLDPALTLACVSESREPFMLPMFPNDKRRAAAAKAELALLFGGNSDQLVIVAAFECWRIAKQRGQEEQFCSRYFVSSSIMNTLSRMRNQLKNELLRHGFIPEDVSSCNLYSRDIGVIQAVLVSGLYPMVGRLLPPTKKEMRSIMENVAGDKVQLHSHSINSKLTYSLGDKHRPLILYDEITRGDGGLHTRNCSVVGSLPLLLLATNFAVAPLKDTFHGESNYVDDYMCESDEQGVNIMSCPDNRVKVVLDRWLQFESTALNVAQVYCLRERMSAAVLFKVRHPRNVLPECLQASMHAIARVLSCGGPSEISLTL